MFECLRRLVLTGVLIFLGPGSSLQIMIGCLFAFACIRLYFFFQPYIATKSDWLSEFANLQIFLSFFAALCLRTGVASARGANQDVFGVLLVLLNITSPCIALYIVVFRPDMDDSESSLDIVLGIAEKGEIGDDEEKKKMGGKESEDENGTDAIESSLRDDDGNGCENGRRKGWEGWGVDWKWPAWAPFGSFGPVASRILSRRDGNNSASISTPTSFLHSTHSTLRNLTRMITKTSARVDIMKIKQGGQEGEGGRISSGASGRGGQLAEDIEAGIELSR